MKKSAVAAAAAALVVPAVGLAAPTAARPFDGSDLLTTSEVAAIYPTARGGARSVSAFPLFAPRECDRIINVRGVSRRTVSFIPGDLDRGPDIQQAVVRFASVKRARALVRRYRTYLRACTGTRQVDDGEGGQATVRVRPFGVPRIGDASVGMLDAFISAGDALWTRTLVVRTGRTVTVQAVHPQHGTGSQQRVVRLSRLALHNVS